MHRGIRGCGAISALTTSQFGKQLGKRVGTAVQRIQKDLAGFIADIDGLLDMSRKKQFRERLATRAACYSLLEKAERLKDY
jgi:hypothetical protein